MDIGKIINHLSSRLRSRSQEVHTKLGIGNAQGKILNFILVESALHPVYQKDIEKEFSLRPPTVTEMLSPWKPENSSSGSRMSRTDALSRSFLPRKLLP